MTAGPLAPAALLPHCHDVMFIMSARRTILKSGGILVAAAAASLILPKHWRAVAMQRIFDPSPTPPSDTVPLFKQPEPWARRLLAAGLGQIGQTVGYDGSYTTIDYPGGDVSLATGVCTDVIIRAYRTGLGFDLQKAVHEDMAAAYGDYPHLWGLNQPDANIDHRRVPNLQTFFARYKAELAVSMRGVDYRPGDIVAMLLPGRLTHIALVAAQSSTDRERPLIIHNIGAGTRVEDSLFAYELTGHYRFNPG